MFPPGEAGQPYTKETVTYFLGTHVRGQLGEPSLALSIVSRDGFCQEEGGKTPVPQGLGEERAAAEFRLSFFK